MSKKVKTYKHSDAEKACIAIPMFSQVETPDGVGIVVDITGANPNGLYWTPGRVRFTVWYGAVDECPYTEWHGAGQEARGYGLGKYTMREYSVDELKLFDTETYVRKAEY